MSYTVRKVWTCLAWRKCQLLTQGHHYQSEVPCTGKKSSKPLKWVVIRVSLMPHPPPSLSTLLSPMVGTREQSQAGTAQPLQGRGVMEAFPALRLGTDPSGPNTPLLSHSLCWDTPGSQWHPLTKDNDTKNTMEPQTQAAQLKQVAGRRKLEFHG